MGGVAIESGDKDLDNIFVKERVVAFFVVWDDFAVDAGPVDIEKDTIMAEWGRGCTICTAVNVGERDYYWCVATRDIESLSQREKQQAG